MDKGEAVLSSKDRSSRTVMRRRLSTLVLHAVGMLFTKVGLDSAAAAFTAVRQSLVSLVELERRAEAATPAGSTVKGQSHSLYFVRIVVMVGLKEIVVADSTMFASYRCLLHHVLDHPCS